MTGKRTRIINDPSDLVPLLQAFGSDVHKKIFDELSKDWDTERELCTLVGDENSVHRSVALLRKSGLVESKWRVPEPGASPEKEYHSTYSRVGDKKLPIFAVRQDKRWITNLIRWSMKECVSVSKNAIAAMIFAQKL